MWEVKSSQEITEQVKHLLEEQLKKGNLKKYNFEKIKRTFALETQSGAGMNIALLSDYVVRIRFLNKYEFDTIVYQEEKDEDVQLVLSQISSLINSLSAVDYKEYIVVVNVIKKQWNELEIEFDPLNEGLKIVTFSSHRHFLRKLSAKILGSRRLRVNSKTSSGSE